jgi:hypothetical protein
LATIAGDTTSIDGKITACNTGAVVISSGSVNATCTATDLDVRDLTSATDSIAIYGSDDGGTTKRIIKTDSGGAIQVDLEVASVTANAGTNLNTSALALETGGNLATIAGDTTSIDGKITACDTGSIAGTVTANAGTNLNTSALALETGGNLATIAGDTTSIDGKITACNTGAVVISSGAVTETNSAAIKTAVELIDNAISGSEMQVDVVAALPAGTNAIGKLAANSGVDIGDVDVTSVPGCLQGPGNPTIDSVSQVAINLTTGANQVLVSSAASKQIWVWGVTFTCGDADGQTVSFQDEDDTAITGVMEFAQYGGMAHSPSGNFSMPLWKLGTDKDLEVDITGGDVDGFLTYSLVSV